MTAAESALVRIHTLISDNHKTGMKYYGDVPQSPTNRQPKSDHDLLGELKMVCEEVVPILKAE